MLLAGGILGTAVGVWLFTVLRGLGQLDLTIGISYVVLLTAVGGLMVSESVRAILRQRSRASPPTRRGGAHCTWVHGLPLKMRFKRSKIYVSAIPVWLIGFIIGFVGAVMGIGGGFLLVPMLIYRRRVPTATVIGTSMVLTLITMASATVMHAATNHLVDAVLALILMIGGVIGCAVRRSRRTKHARRTAAAATWFAGAGGGTALCVPTRGAARRSLFHSTTGCRMMQRLTIAGVALVTVVTSATPAAAGQAGDVDFTPPGDGELELYRHLDRTVWHGRA